MNAGHTLALGTLMLVLAGTWTALALGCGNAGEEPRTAANTPEVPPSNDRPLQADEGPNEPPGGANGNVTPQGPHAEIAACFATFKQAMNKNDFEAVFDVLTESYRRKFVSQTVVAAHMNRFRAQQDSQAREQESWQRLNEIFSDNDVDIDGNPIRFIQRLAAPDGAEQIYERIGDPLGFLHDYAEWTESHPSTARFQEQLKVTDSLQEIHLVDDQTARVGISPSRQLHVVHDGARWRIDGLTHDRDR